MLRLSESHPHVERSIFHVLHATADHVPGLLAKQSGLADPTGAAVTTAIAEGLVDVKGMVDEYRIFGAPWGFEPKEISRPTQIWQGTADELVPEEWGRRLSEEVPGATLHLVDGGTHFLWYEHWTDILGGLIAADNPERL